MEEQIDKSDMEDKVGKEDDNQIVEDEKVLVWKGVLKWYGHHNSSNQYQDPPQEMSCTFYTKTVQGVPEVPLNLVEEQETLENFGKNKLSLHLIPRSQLKKLDMKYLQDTKNIKLSIENCPAKNSMTKLLRTGRYAGCIHLVGIGNDTVVPFLSSSSTTIQQLSPEMGVIILLYSRGKQTTIGFVPNNMNEFVAKLLQAIPDHSAKNQGQQDEKKNELPELDEKDSSSTTIVDNASEMATQQQQDQNYMEIEEIIPSQNYWNYEIPQNFKPTSHLAVTQQEESDKKLNFYKGCKWAPDGSCLISNSDDDILRLYNVPESLYGVSDWSQQGSEENILKIDTVLQIKEGGQVYDYCWYPLMSSYDPVSCCFATTTSDAPVHLWDAFTGKLRASYLAYDHLDQVVAARTVAFSADSGQSIFCGFDTLVRIFDITRPGRQCTERKLKHLQLTELSQPGIVSCITVNPKLSSVMAIGSYLKTVGLYHGDGSVLCILQGHLGGVTHLKFSPDGTKLFSGGRKDSRLICWDMRYMGERYTIFDRVVNTNQRIYFDITPNGKYLISGGTDGQVLIWDLTTQQQVQNDDDDNKSNMISSFQANSDCVNGVSINPFLPLLATSSGQRHFCKMTNFSDTDDSDSDSDSVQVQKQERDIKLWKLC